MKLTKMSLVAGLLLGANLYAVDNVEVGGDAKLFYGTQFATTAGGSNQPPLFDKDVSYADFGFNIGVTADLMENVKGAAKFQVMSTLGMENSIAAFGPWSNSHISDSGVLETTEWMAEAWIEGKFGNTTATVGRQTLDTPFIFTETWSTDYNTFEAALIVNEDIPDTTLVGAWIGDSNGVGVDNEDGTPIIGNVTSRGGVFKTIGSDGAGILGVTNNSYKPLTAQGWYYKLPNTLDAYWLQADLDMDGFLAGIQYTNVDVEGENNDDSAYALMVGYAIPDTVTITAAYSSVDDQGSTRGSVNNIATDGQAAGSASSLYTEFWWWFQTASSTGADTMMLSAESTVADVDLFLGLYSADIEVAGSGVTNEVDEITFTAAKSFGPIDTSIALIYDMFDTNAAKAPGYTEDLTTFQLYLTYNF